jgi:curved DNA-binding protein CbpA
VGTVWVFVPGEGHWRLEDLSWLTIHQQLQLEKGERPPHAFSSEYRQYKGFFVNQLKVPERLLSLYEVLGVQRNAGNDELRKAYHDLNRLYHPDRTACHLALARRKLDEAQQAFAILFNQKARALYDKYGEDWRRHYLGGDLEDPDEDNGWRHGWYRPAPPTESDDETAAASGMLQVDSAHADTERRSETQHDEAGAEVATPDTQQEEPSEQPAPEQPQPPEPPAVGQPLQPPEPPAPGQPEQPELEQLVGQPEAEQPGEQEEFEPIELPVQQGAPVMQQGATVAGTVAGIPVVDAQPLHIAQRRPSVLVSVLVAAVAILFATLFVSNNELHATRRELRTLHALHALHAHHRAEAPELETAVVVEERPRRQRNGKETATPQEAARQHKIESLRAELARMAAEDE